MRGVTVGVCLLWISLSSMRSLYAEHIAFCLLVTGVATEGGWHRKEGGHEVSKLTVLS